MSDASTWRGRCVPTVHVHHSLQGAGMTARAHIVSIRDPDGALVAEFDGARSAAAWLKQRDYDYVTGTNGCWAQAGPR